MKPIDETPLAYSVAQLARLTGISTQTIYKEIKEGNLKVKQVGTRFIVPHDAAQEWLNR